MENETTFKETTEFLINNGWERINLNQYKQEKELKKHQTARIGMYCYFRLKKSNDEILKSNQENILDYNKKYATVEATIRLVMKLEIEIKSRILEIENRLKILENEKPNKTKTK